MGALGMRGSGIEIENRAVVRASQPAIEPAAELRLGRERRNATETDGGEDRTTDEDLSSRVALSIRHVGTGDKPAAPGFEPGKRLIDGLKTRADSLGLRHGDLHPAQRNWISAFGHMSNRPAAKRLSRMPTNGRHREAARRVLDSRVSEGNSLGGRRRQSWILFRAYATTSAANTTLSMDKGWLTRVRQIRHRRRAEPALFNDSIARCAVRTVRSTTRCRRGWFKAGRPG
jgi:hypothetical protein